MNGLELKKKMVPLANCAYAVKGFLGAFGSGWLTSC